MVNLIVGSSGTGKTKQLVEKVVDTAKNSKGNVVCIDKGKSCLCFCRQISALLTWGIII